MLGNDKPYRALPPIWIVSFEVDETSPGKDLPHSLTQEVIDGGRIGGKRIDDDTVSVEALFVGQSQFPAGPTRREHLFGKCPSQEAANSLILVYDEQIVPARDLMKEHLSPFAKRQSRERRFGAQIFD